MLLLNQQISSYWLWKIGFHIPLWALLASIDRPTKLWYQVRSIHAFQWSDPRRLSSSVRSWIKKLCYRVNDCIVLMQRITRRGLQGNSSRRNSELRGLKLCNTIRKLKALSSDLRKMDLSQNELPIHRATTVIHWPSNLWIRNTPFNFRPLVLPVRSRATISSTTIDNNSVSAFFSAPFWFLSCSRSNNFSFFFFLSNYIVLECPIFRWKFWIRHVMLTLNVLCWFFHRSSFFLHFSQKSVMQLFRYDVIFMHRRIKLVPL